ncbi:GTPase IMAP family member 8-like [Myxocyprinus asiaticus]|uniref:GTPase IMAP family member 8-like n=1 Tax=Myxocyprinus asiaticus TaxID=70543 RepID=UPI0022232B86|nr:GTPase IMAP family member 8-like [Myxocyprinus asiaticus]
MSQKRTYPSGAEKRKKKKTEKEKKQQDKGALLKYFGGGAQPTPPVPNASATADDDTAGPSSAGEEHLPAPASTDPIVPSMSVSTSADVAELRVVVLGFKSFEKATVINSILGDRVESDKYFVKSVRRDGEVNGRKITLINTPCWWKIFGLSDSPEVVKQELVCSVFKCPPGPHVFLLVIDLSLPFTREHRISIEEHLNLFGERIWSHIIVLFTRTVSLNDKSIEQHIQSQGEDLQQIIQRCGGRFLVFCNENKNKGAQVKELLVKIDGVVAANDGKHFETGDEKLLEVQKKREDIQERAKARRLKVQKETELLTENGDVLSLQSLRVVLVGWILSGKSLAGNTILNQDIFKAEKTKKYVQGSGEVNGRKITVTDTPGWWKYVSTQFNPEFVRTSILESISESGKSPHAVLLLIPADASFQQEQKRIIEENMTTLGEDVWRHTIVLFTWADRYPDISIEEHIESEGDALQWLIEKCGNRYHVFDNTDIKNRDQVTELLQKIDQMVAGNCLFRLDTKCDAEMNLHKTDTQQDLDLEEEISLDPQHVLKILSDELNNRLKAITNMAKEIQKDFTEHNDSSSLSKPPNFKEESNKPSETPISKHQQQIQQQPVDEKLTDQIKREGRRWETIIMEGLLNILQNSKASRDENVIQIPGVDVWKWLQRCEQYSTSGYETMSNLSDPAEDPQNTDISEDTVNLQQNQH